ncbi:MAG TPA: NAD(P)/FAD-dependent oxidoreductase, partial [Pilimelia sp.]|nr:NAD(P)/FAD-dependent oxidoreductase [Pilimelia sp.]
MRDTDIDPAAVAAPASDPPPVVVIGAGPAGLTAALLLARAGRAVTVLEASDEVGGISRTVERDGWRFDLGGHRFFTKVPEVERLWHDILPDGDFLRRPRMSRILYRGRLFDYPLRPLNALRGLGLVESARCVASYLAARVRPPRDQSNFEGWVAARFGYRLYQIFFKTYTEKVWGVPATAIQADWAAQRIKNLSLGSAIAAALRPRRGSTEITTLIDQFQYPKLGPGMMWERARELAEEAGARVLTAAPVRAVHRERGRAVAVTADVAGRSVRMPCAAVISSMPLTELVLGMDPPADVAAAARGLSYRDFLTVALVLPTDRAFPDNWIYVHTPGVRVGRVQNFGSWSPYLVKEGRTCLGLEYFVNEGDDLWSLPDADLVDLARRELGRLGLVDTAEVEAGYVVRVPKAYPVYDAGYDQRVAVLRDWLAAHAGNVQPVGRNGMHKYNNQDHSMLTAMLAVENLDGHRHDLWSVNVEAEYHETDRRGAPGSGTGRQAPVLPTP